MRLRVLPYKMGSQSAKFLAQALRLKRVYPDGRSSFRSRPRDIIINWGSSALPQGLTRAGLILNKPQNVALSSNKLTMLTRLKERGVPCLEFTTDQRVVREWLAAGEVAFARTLLNSHSGRGIVEVETPEQLVYAPLYTKYVKKKHEYRVHVLPNGKFEIRQKRKRLNAENVSSRIRNHAGGYNFCKDLSFLPEDLTKVAKDAVVALGLDFGAIDILYNERQNKCYIIECNSAPGLEGSSVEIYSQAFKERLEECF